MRRDLAIGAMFIVQMALFFVIGLNVGRGLLWQGVYIDDDPVPIACPINRIPGPPVYLDLIAGTEFGIRGFISTDEYRERTRWLKQGCSMSHQQASTR